MSPVDGCCGNSERDVQLTFSAKAWASPPPSVGDLVERASQLLLAANIQLSDCIDRWRQFGSYRVN
jgi:hypothetical protein